MSRSCHYCKRVGGKGPRELRPYGPGGVDVCAECVLGNSAPPDRRRTAEAALGRQLMTHEPLLLDVGEQAGPRPLKPRGDS